jgi:hypothetical protein
MALRHFDSLHPHARHLATVCMEWMDGYWDNAAGLLWYPGERPYVRVASCAWPHVVRETAWYALGLLMRGAPGERERAFQAIQAILSYQLHEPGQPRHGTWLRSPEEVHPQMESQASYDYDPNWREFIGTTLAIVLLEYESVLPQALIESIDAALRAAAAGAFAREVPASYSNIALMHAFLLRFAADRFGEPAWAAASEEMAREIHRLFDAQGAFAEYNSPTYYGVDLYALALWRCHSSSQILRDLGADMEARLWLDVAQFYHAEMRNMCGPFDRIYGMDMRRYVNLLGMWIWIVVGRKLSPFPDTLGTVAHAHDLCFGPCFALLGAKVPEEVLPHLLAFQGERHVRRVITPSPTRVATAWISEDVMLGGENTSGRTPGSSQFAPATMHWRCGDDVGWMRLKHNVPVDAWAEEDQLTISARAQETAAVDLVFEIHARGVDAQAIRRDRWELPCLTVEVETDADGPTVTQDDELMTLRFTANVQRAEEEVRFTLRTRATPGVPSC